jgi:hypothetical protein
LFCDEFTVAHHTKLRLLHHVCVITALAVSVVDNHTDMQQAARVNFSVLSYPQK